MNRFFSKIFLSKSFGRKFQNPKGGVQRTSKTGVSRGPNNYWKNNCG